MDASWANTFVEEAVALVLTKKGGKPGHINASSFFFKLMYIFVRICANLHAFFKWAFGSSKEG